MATLAVFLEGVLAILDSNQRRMIDVSEFEEEEGTSGEAAQRDGCVVPPPSRKRGPVPHPQVDHLNIPVWRGIFGHPSPCVSYHVCTRSVKASGRGVDAKYPAIHWGETEAGDDALTPPPLERAAKRRRRGETRGLPPRCFFFFTSHFRVIFTNLNKMSGKGKGESSGNVQGIPRGVCIPLVNGCCWWRDTSRIFAPLPFESRR